MINISLKNITAMVAFTVSVSSAPLLAAHPTGATAQYIANEGVMVESGAVKVLFDPIFDNGFGAFQLIDPQTNARLFAGDTPFDGVDAVFVSHAHGDHFAAKDMIAYLNAQPQVKLFAPHQALEKMQEHETWYDDLLPRIFASPLDLNASEDHIFELDGVPVAMTRLRVNHIGGERHAKIENIVFRVVLGQTSTVMHLGDADVALVGSEAHAGVFDTVRSHIAFAPYWFVGKETDPNTLEFLNSDQMIGVHVPIKVPADLIESGADYFSVPGETREIGK